MKYTALGAAHEVTGSQHLIEAGSRRFLLDCGLFQGRRAESHLKNETFSCHPKDLDAVILSHAHIDHCGNLPRLYRAGFRGDIYCTRATAEIASVMLMDAAKIQREDARYLRKKGLMEGGRPAEPLYDEDDVAAVRKKFTVIPYGHVEKLSTDVRLEFLEAGHILGSAITQLDILEGADWKRVIYTGDLGRRDLPLLRDPQTVGRCDLLIIESTYAGRIHPPVEDQEKILLRIIRETYEKGGRIIIPAFALGRTQHVLYILNNLSNAGLLPTMPVYVDSPLAKELTSIYRRHQDDMDAEIQQLRQTDPNPFSFPGLQYIGSPQESATLNFREGPFLVIASSGMCENGRIVHHLKHGLGDERNTVVVIGYQAQDTLGRRLVERHPIVRIFGRPIDVKAKIEVLNGLSAHADQDDFRWWLGELQREGGTGHSFVVHGEEAAGLAMAELLHEVSDASPILPVRGQTYDLETF